MRGLGSSVIALLWLGLAAWVSGQEGANTDAADPLTLPESAAVDTTETPPGQLTFRPPTPLGGDIWGQTYHRYSHPPVHSCPECVPDVSPPCPCQPCVSVYGSAEVLAWWLQDQFFPVLITTGTEVSQGILGQPGTRVLFGGRREDLNERLGGRFTAGVWFDDCRTSAVEVSGFFLGERSVPFVVNSVAAPVIARPFVDINNNRPFRELATFPGILTGSVSVRAPTSLWGIEANLRKKLCCTCNWQWYGYLGFRVLDLDEGLEIIENLIAQTTIATDRGNILPGDTINVTDRFDTDNVFYGAQIGLGTEYQYGRWFVDMKAKLAVGGVAQKVHINGFQVIQTAGGVQEFTGGLLALPSNIGRHSRGRVAVVPEWNVNVGYQLHPHCRAFVGYSFLYLSNVVRPGDQIDLNVDVTQIPNFATDAQPANVNQPAVLFRDTDFWAQGLNFGLEFRY
ncbi:MAG: BBP7 family outer membrane beta-barrel protein [Gemmataceae bacterium]